MKVFVLDTALPLAQGSPRQRVAANLLSVLQSRADVRQLTLDAFGTEWNARMQMCRGDRLMGAARAVPGARRFLALPIAHAQSPVTVAEAETVRLLDDRWMNSRRLSRLLALVAQAEPDLVVLADPLLAPIGARLVLAGHSVRMIETGQAAWHQAMSHRLSDAAPSLWHSGLASALQSEAAVLPGVAIATALPLPVAWDDLFLAKTASVVVPATGLAWLDQPILHDLAEDLAALAAQGLAAPDVILIGFAKDMAQLVPGATCHTDWQHLGGLAGAARCLWLPCMTPELARVAEAALSLGTPVVTSAADAGLHGLAGQEGVLTPPRFGRAGVLAQLLDRDLVTEAVWRDVAKAAGARAAALRAAAFPMLPPARSGVVTPHRPRRVRPLVGRCEAFYNPLSRLLLLRMAFLSSAGIDEVRLFDDRGTEINRFMPNAALMALRVVPMEGSMIVRPAEIGSGVRVELHGSAGLVEEVFLPVADFVTLKAEIALAEADGAVLHGAFWAQTPEPGTRWALGDDQFKAEVSSATAIAMPDLDGVIVPFSVPLQAGQRTSISIWQRPPGAVGFHRPDQRPFNGTRMTSLPAPLRPAASIMALRGIHAGKRAWIIGNGPSVRLDDLAAIPSGDVTFCFNRFYLSYADQPLRESYVVSADTLMVQDFGQEMIERSSGLPLFCVNRAPSHKLRGPHVLLPPGDSYLPVFSTDPTRFVSVGGSSVFVALQMAHWMGIRDVVLYGMDYSFVMKPRRDPRFAFPVSFEEGNHFITSYRGAKPWCPPTWRDIAAGFLNARVAFEVAGGSIVNATRGGLLETFPRAAFETLLG